MIGPSSRIPPPFVTAPCGFRAVQLHAVENRRQSKSICIATLISIRDDPGARALRSLSKAREPRLIGKSEGTASVQYTSVCLVFPRYERRDGGQGWVLGRGGLLQRVLGETRGRKLSETRRESLSKLSSALPVFNEYLCERNIPAALCLEAGQRDGRF